MLTRSSLPAAFAALTLIIAPASAGAMDLPARLSLAPAVRTLVGEVRGDFFRPQARISDQVIEGLGVPSPDQAAGDRLTLISGCRPHSCNEKSAVLRNESGAVLGVALINFHCHQPTAKAAAIRSCDPVPTLTVITRTSASPDRAADILMRWGRSISPGISLEQIRGRRPGLRSPR